MGTLMGRKQDFEDLRFLDTHAHSSIIHSSQNVEAAKCPSMEGGIKKMWCIHVTERDSALKRKGRYAQ